LAHLGALLKTRALLYLSMACAFAMASVRRRKGFGGLKISAIRLAYCVCSESGDNNMETIFKLLIARLIAKTAELFDQMNQDPMMSDNYLLSVAFIDFKNLKPRKQLDVEAYTQIMLLYVMGWLDEYLREIDIENDKNQIEVLILCWFFKYLNGTSIQIKNSTEFLRLQSEIDKFISDDRISKIKKQTIIQIGSWNAAFDKTDGGNDYNLAIVLNEWMAFKELK
jgi:hypothetical protein